MQQRNPQRRLVRYRNWDNVLPWSGRLIVLAGIAALLLASHSMVQALRATNWPTVDAEILKSKINYTETTGSALASSRRSTHLSLPVYEILYGYSVNGVPYTGSRIRFGGIDEYSGVKEYERQIRELERIYSPGSRHPVHYNPGSPATATLQTGMSRGLKLLFGLGLALLSGGIWFLRWLRYKIPTMPVYGDWK